MPLVKLVDELLGGKQFSGSSVFFAGHQPIINISDVKVVEAMYTTRNLFFDKHPVVKHLTLRLTGNSILFDETSER
jgi:cytochrome P450